MLLKTQKLGLEKRKEERENIYSSIICLTPPVLWNIKVHLPVSSSGEKCQRSACPLRCALKSGRIVRCYSPHSSQRPAFAQTSPISAQHKGQPSAVCAKTLLIQLATPQMTKIQYTIFPLWLSFAQGSLSHATTLKGCELIVSSCCPKKARHRTKRYPTSSFKWKNSGIISQKWQRKHLVHAVLCNIKINRCK